MKVSLRLLALCCVFCVFCVFCVVCVVCVVSCGPSAGSTFGGSSAHAADGARLYRAHCSACHGGDGSGSAMGLGPTLRGLAEHWEKNSLHAYLSDPAGSSRSIDRLGSRPMPAWPDSLTVEERAALVDHTLGLMR